MRGVRDQVPGTVVIRAGEHALRVFDLIYVLTSNSEATISISGYAREQMVSFQEMGTGSAASVLVFMMVAGIAACFLWINRFSHEGKENKE